MLFDSIGLWTLSFSLTVGGFFFGWNSGLSVGYGNFSFICAVMGIGYLCLMFCNAEISGSLSSVSKAFRLARCTLGYYLGFIVGICEYLEFTLLLSLSIYALSSIIVQCLDISIHFAPIFWVLTYLLFLFISSGKKKIFVSCLKIFSLLSLLVLLIFCFGLMFAADCKFSSVEAFSLPKTIEHYSIVKYAAWFFVGIETASFMVGSSRYNRTSKLSITDPETWASQSSSTRLDSELSSQSSESNIFKLKRSSLSIPMVLCMGFLLFLSQFVLISSSCNHDGFPSTFESSFAPIGLGFPLIFDGSDSSFKVGLCLSIPAVLSSSYGFFFASEQIMIALAQSRLMPRSMVIHKKYCIPTFAFCMIWLVFLFMNSSIFNDLVGLAMLCAFLAYVCQSVGFSLFRAYCPNFPRKFLSPFGHMGAIISIVVFLLGMIGILISFRSHCLMGIIILGFFFLSSLYYYFYARHHQSFCEDEYHILFIAEAVRGLEHHHPMKLRKPRYIGPSRVPQKRQLSSNFRSKITKSSIYPDGGSWYSNSVNTISTSSSQSVLSCCSSDSQNLSWVREDGSESEEGARQSITDTASSNQDASSLVDSNSNNNSNNNSNSNSNNNSNNSNNSINATSNSDHNLSLYHRSEICSVPPFDLENALNITEDTNEQDEVKSEASFQSCDSYCDRHRFSSVTSTPRGEIISSPYMKESVRTSFSLSFSLPFSFSLSSAVAAAVETVAAATGSSGETPGGSFSFRERVKERLSFSARSSGLSELMEEGTNHHSEMDGRDLLDKENDRALDYISSSQDYLEEIELPNSAAMKYVPSTRLLLDAGDNNVAHESQLEL